MTAESKCPKCGTVLTDDPDIGHTGLEITKDGPWHSSNRCRDVLRAQLTEVTRQRDEAIRIAFLALPTNSPLLGALEALRGK